MKKLILILITIFFTTAVNAHDTKKINFDLKKIVQKKDLHLIGFQNINLQKVVS